MIVKETFQLKLTYEMSIDTETGEILEQKLIDRTVDKSDLKPKTVKKKVKNEDPEPKLYLEENKYVLNSAAVELMELEPGMKLIINYEVVDGKSIPVIGEEDAFGVKGGNKLTKSYTVACRGNANQQLANFGTEFLVAPKDDSLVIFKLISQNGLIEEDDETIVFDDTDIELDELDDLTTDINSNIFNFNL